MRFLHWFRTTNALRREADDLRSWLVEAAELLEEAREEAAELAAERDGLRVQLAEVLRERDGLRVQLDVAVRERDPVWRLVADVSPAAATRGEVLRERARADALEERLARLQEANMATDRAL
ncbi:hypothetical protein GCM10017673_14620 [Streptosporangium violaceochromogenes]|nr:hypothetical protein GCM10017673_14620 [Streptosporangium violaceochromogenes]